MAVESIQISSTLGFRLGLMAPIWSAIPRSHDLVALLISPEGLKELR